MPLPRACVDGAQRALGTRLSAVAALVVRPTTAFREPGRAPVARFELKNVNGAPTVFSVLGERVDARCRATWLHVQLPIRPNGATGWVRAADVSIARVHTRILVDLSERRVRFFRNGRLVLSSSAAIGSSATRRRSAATTSTRGSFRPTRRGRTVRAPSASPRSLRC